ncbi:MAG: tetratricopeptide repeat protein [Nitrospiraceae bacterium]|nr:tetratricopeptide repeat protein [Nitrospiraceae bacterium]
MHKPIIGAILRTAALVLLFAGAVIAGPPSPGRNGDDEILMLRQKISSDPGDSAQLIRLGFLLLDKSATDEALACFDRALALNPRSGEAKTGKGIVLSRKGSLPEAVRVLKDALLLNPNPVRAHYELGRIYEQQGDAEKALAEYKMGIVKHEQGR